jgi:hypothetical protein
MHKRANCCRAADSKQDGAQKSESCSRMVPCRQRNRRHSLLLELQSISPQGGTTESARLRKNEVHLVALGMLISASHDSDGRSDHLKYTQAVPAAKDR